MSISSKDFLLVLAKSFQIALKWNLWKWLITGGLGSFLGLLQFGKNFFSIGITPSVLYGIGAIVILFLIRFFLICFNQTVKFYHDIYINSVYGDVIILLKESFSSMHHYRKTQGHQDDEFMKSMILLCNNLKLIFDKITQDECSVSIKVPLSLNKVDEKNNFNESN